MTLVSLPRSDGSVERYRLGTHPPVAEVRGPPRARVVHAAAHIVADPLGDPVGTGAIDWDATLAFRRHLWRLGFGVAEAMDTAQRGMGLGRGAVLELIERSLAEARAEGGAIVCGINTDALDGPAHRLADITAAYREQLEYVQRRGGAAVMMASRALAAAATGPDDYARVYADVLGDAQAPVILHWLGPMFDPALTGYFGSVDAYEAMHVLLGIIDANAGEVDGVKVSMLDAQLETELRRRLPAGLRCYTGDDFNFPSLILGDGAHHSDALLGIFDGIAPVAMAALCALDQGDESTFSALLEPTVPLSRLLFAAPTWHYKTGLTFLAYLNGHQGHFRMLGGQESARSVIHLADVVRLADAAGLLADADRVASRLRPVFASAGIR